MANTNAKMPRFCHSVNEPLAETARIGHFKNNKKFRRIDFIENSIVFTF